jgi:hypothetical protein
MILKICRLKSILNILNFVIDKKDVMATYSVTINEKTATGKNLLSLLQSMNDIVTITPQVANEINQTISKDEFMSDLKQSVSDAKSRNTKPLNMLING